MDAQWKLEEHYFCKAISAVTAEFNGFTVPKQAVCTTSSAVSPEVVGAFCGYKFQFSSLFPVKSISLDKRAADQKGQF